MLSALMCDYSLNPVLPDRTPQTPTRTPPPALPTPAPVEFPTFLPAPVEIPTSTSVSIYETTSGGSVRFVTMTLSENPVASTSAVSDSEGEHTSFLDNKALSGFFFTFIGIGTFIGVVMIATWALRRKRHNRLLEEAVAFDPTSVGEKYPDDIERGSMEKHRISSSTGGGRGPPGSPTSVHGFQGQGGHVPPLQSQGLQEYPVQEQAYTSHYGQQSPWFNPPSHPSHIPAPPRSPNPYDPNFVPAPPRSPNPIYDPSLSPHPSVSPSRSPSPIYDPSRGPVPPGLQHEMDMTSQSPQSRGYLYDVNGDAHRYSWGTNPRSSHHEGSYDRHSVHDQSQYLNNRKVRRSLSDFLMLSHVNELGP